MQLNAKEKRLVYAIALSVTFMIVEVIGGWLANSIAIYSDAAHLLTDIAGFGIALVAVTAARSPGNEFLTFGLVRAEIFGALLSVFSLWVISVVLLWAAYDRGLKWFQGRPEPINGKMMLGVALFGVFVNLCLGYIFHDEHGHSLAHDHSHGHAHGHAHGHDHSSVASSPLHSDNLHDLEHGHDHSHDYHARQTERSSLLSGQKSPPASSSSNSSKTHNGQKYTILDAEDDDHAGNDHDHDHSHQHRHGHDHGHCSGHDHGHGHDHTSSNSYHNDVSPLSIHDDHAHGHVHGKENTATKSNVVDANLEAAQLHVLADLAQSIGVALAAVIIIVKPHWQIVDPLCTLLATVFGLWSTMPLISRGMMILLEGVPSHVDWREVLRRLEAIPGVDDVHDLHIWSLSSDTTSLSVHMRAQDPRDALRQAHIVCRDLGIAHATIQVHDASDDEYCHAESCKITSGLPPHAQHKHIAAKSQEHNSNKTKRSSSHDHDHGHKHDHGHDHGHDYGRRRDSNSSKPASTIVPKEIATMNISSGKSASSGSVDQV